MKLDQTICGTIEVVNQIPFKHLLPAFLSMAELPDLLVKLLFHFGRIFASLMIAILENEKFGIIII